MIAKSQSRAFVSLLCWLVLSVGVFVLLPLYLGIRTHLYLYHSAPEGDPLRMFKAMVALLVVVVVSAVTLSSLIGRFLQQNLRKYREQLKSPPPAPKLVQSSNGRASSAKGDMSRNVPGYPGLDTDTEKTRVLEELLQEERDEKIRQRLRIALKGRQAETESNNNTGIS